MKIAFSHSSNEYRTEFTSRDPRRPTFYWFSDRFHDHYGYGIDGSYFYLFVKDPIYDKISLRARNGTKRDFHNLYKDFFRLRDIIKRSIKSIKLGYYPFLNVFLPSVTMATVKLNSKLRI